MATSEILVFMRCCLAECFWPFSPPGGTQAQGVYTHSRAPTHYSNTKCSGGWKTSSEGEMDVMPLSALHHSAVQCASCAPFSDKNTFF